MIVLKKFKINKMKKLIFIMFGFLAITACTGSQKGEGDNQKNDSISVDSIEVVDSIEIEDSI